MTTDKTIDNVINRRTVLVAGLAGAGTLTLAACGSSSGGSGSGATDTQTSAAPQTSASSQDSTSASSAPTTEDSSTSSSAGSASAKPSGTQLAKLDDITVGSAISAQLDGKPVIVARPTETTAVCFSAKCTHMGCTVAPKGKELDCPCHGSSFNATTGAVLGGPAPSPLNKVAVTVSNGAVFAAG